MVLRDSRFGRFYGCSSYPKCQSTHGCHPDGRPLGKPADKATKQARIRAHEAFDQLWKSEPPRFSRRAAYRWMQQAMGLSKDEAHIGNFDASQCAALIERVTAFLKQESA